MLDAYYVNLVRTHSQNTYVLAPAQTSPELSSEDSDMESGLSEPPSPSQVPLPSSDDREGVEAVPIRTEANATRRRNVHEGDSMVVEPSAVLIERATLSPAPSTGPTIEQNMAFEALQRESSSTEVEQQSTAIKKSRVPNDGPASATASPGSGRENTRRRSFETVHADAVPGSEESEYKDSPRPRTRQRTEIETTPQSFNREM